MKTLLMIDNSLGQARSHLAKRMLGAAAVKTGLTLVESAAEAELVVVIGKTARKVAEADAMATMYLSLGANKAIALSRKIPDAKVYFILDDGKDGYEIYCSPAMQEMMIPE